jgi:hypothetical protein
MYPIKSDKEKPTRLNLSGKPVEMDRGLVLSDSPLEGILPGNEYLIINVPLCERCAERLFRWFKLSQWLLWPAVIVSLARMFNRDRANVAVTIQVHHRVLVQVFGFENRCLTELDIEGVGICKIFDFHGTNDRSKNALCTVSRSGSKTTRKYRPSAS